MLEVGDLDPGARLVLDAFRRLDAFHPRPSWHSLDELSGSSRSAQGADLRRSLAELERLEIVQARSASSGAASWKLSSQGSAVVRRAGRFVRHGAVSAASGSGRVIADRLFRRAVSSVQVRSE